MQVNGYPVVLLAEPRTVRLVATARLRDPVLLGLVNKDQLDDLAEIEGATSGRLTAQAIGSARLERGELVAGIPHAYFINAAFAYWRPRDLNRFNGPDRGAWYAAFVVETCLAEVTFHMTRELARVGEYQAVVDYAEMFAAFAGHFIDLRKVMPMPPCLDTDPAKGYPAGNGLAQACIAAGHNGIVYPSVRRPEGDCLVALLPQAVQSVAQGGVLRLTWRGKPQPGIARLA
ncbi:RES family NAD+ phosphorylase [Ferrovibrio sp.]|uniref:RES family NAD+ phosphorylase n=1 Tax=Ferrovibrio sp. TaxID=1917215 RepID=UPI0035AF81E1